MSYSVWTSIPLSALLAFCIVPPSVGNAELVPLEIGFDRWMYPFNGTPGLRATGSVFGALGSADFDNRDAQVLVGFDTSPMATLSGSRALISLTLTVTTASSNTFVYDPTVDPLESYLSDPDADDGRPLELFGVAVRNGFLRPTLDTNSTDPLLFKETSPFSTSPGVFRSSRSMFAADALGADVSNNVSNGQSVVPWAVGRTDTVAPGATVPRNTEFRFSIDLNDLETARYVDDALSVGEIYLSLTSFHSASQGGPPSFPSFYLDAGGTSLGPTPRLEFEFGPSSDLNEDGSVDGADLGLLFASWGGTSGPADLNVDQLVDGADVAILFNYWSGDPAPISIAVPELGTPPLGFAVSGLGCRRSRRRVNLSR